MLPVRLKSIGEPNRYFLFFSRPRKTLCLHNFCLEGEKVQNRIRFGVSLSRLLAKDGAEESLETAAVRFVLLRRRCLLCFLHSTSFGRSLRN